VRVIQDEGILVCARWVAGRLGIKRLIRKDTLPGVRSWESWQPASAPSWCVLRRARTITERRPPRSERPAFD
jgi:hypothetical protein